MIAMMNFIRCCLPLLFLGGSLYAQESNPTASPQNDPSAQPTPLPVTAAQGSNSNQIVPSQCSSDVENMVQSVKSMGATSQTVNAMERIMRKRYAKTKNPEEIEKKQEQDVAASGVDAEPGKYGGPSTEIVVKLMRGGTEADANKTSNLLLTAMQNSPNLANRKILAIKRGKPLKAVGATNIPDGTIVFPIRIVVSDPTSTMSSEGMPNFAPIYQDYLYYEDSFGEWSSIRTNPPR